MLYNALHILAVSLLATEVQSKTIRVDIGKGKKFSPDSITADKGDIIEYHFKGSKHSVVAGDYNNACRPATAGTEFYSGKHKSGVFTVEVNSTDPIFVYCSESKHCQQGQVGVVNANDKQTLDDYKKRAKKADSNESPETTFGGVMQSSARQLTASIGVLAGVGALAALVV